MDRTYSREDALAAFEALLGPVEAGRLDVSRRERWWLGLGDDIVAFAAEDDASWTRLLAEGALLRRWRQAGVPASVLRDESPTHRVQLRQRLHGITGAVVEGLLFGVAPDIVADRYATTTPLSPFGQVLAASYGELAATMHSAVPIADGFVGALGHWDPIDLDDVERRLAAYRASAASIAAFAKAAAWLADTPPTDAVLHGDLHFHNMCLADDGRIIGVFDVDAAALGSRWTDLQYVHSLGPRFVAIASAAYERTSGTAVDDDAVRRAHLHTALGHLQWHVPGTPRHASVLAWVNQALIACVPRPESCG